MHDNSRGQEVGRKRSSGCMRSGREMVVDWLERRRSILDFADYRKALRAHLPFTIVLLSLSYASYILQKPGRS